MGNCNSILQQEDDQNLTEMDLEQKISLKKLPPMRKTKNQDSQEIHSIIIYDIDSKNPSEIHIRERGLQIPVTKHHLSREVSFSPSIIISGNKLLPSNYEENWSYYENGNGIEAKRENFHKEYNIEKIEINVSSRSSNKDKNRPEKPKSLVKNDDEEFERFLLEREKSFMKLNGVSDSQNTTRDKKEEDSESTPIKPPRGTNGLEKGLMRSSQALRNIKRKPSRGRKSLFLKEPASFSIRVFPSSRMENDR